MPNIVIVGTQWGDEGKGKVVDVLSPHVDAVARFQGGNNAGHTLVVDGEQIVLHLLPSGALHPDCVCVVGNGVVVDPGVLLREIDQLEARGWSMGSGKLLISAHAHVIMPYHLSLDALRETAKGAKAIGTTRRGIGPAYEDKVGRRGIIVADLLSADRLRERLEAVLPDKNRMISEWYGADAIDLEETLATFAAFGERLAPYVGDGVSLLHRITSTGGSILFEGAQGAFLDVDHGTYPYVTSSNTVAGAACAGTGVGPTAIDEVVGICKAYTTRVGSGPFPTELEGELAEKLRRVGGEYGATTGRARRIGWFDAALLRQSARINGLTRIALTKLDVLSCLDEIPVCVGYEDEDLGFRGSFGAVRPIYETLPGWGSDITGCRTIDELPTNAQAYVARMSELIGVPIELVSVGPGREETILQGDLFRREPSP